MNLALIKCLSMGSTAIGTFLLQGSYSDINNLCTVSVTGGTGDFLLARGWATEAFAIGSVTSAT